MDADLLWTAALTAGLGLIGWVLKSAVDEMQRLNILLNKTREEIGQGLRHQGRQQHRHGSDRGAL